MHIRLQESELATLVEMVCLATQCAMLNRLPEHNSDFQRFIDMEQKILARAVDAGLGDWVEFDHEENRFFLTDSIRQKLYAQKCVDEMRSELFWEEIMFRLAERDLIKKMGAESWESLTDEKQSELTKPLEQRYFAQFSKHGIANLHLISNSHAE